MELASSGGGSSQVASVREDLEHLSLETSDQARVVLNKRKTEGIRSGKMCLCLFLLGGRRLFERNWGGLSQVDVGML